MKTTAAGMLLALAAGAQAETVTMRTEPLRRPDGGYVYCVVEAHSSAAINMVTTIVTRGGANVTAFGSSFVSSPAVNDDGRFHADNTAGSLDKRTVACEVTASSNAPIGDLKIDVTFEARSEGGQALKSVSAQH
jgi:hypothetical protein